MDRMEQEIGDYYGLGKERARLRDDPPGLLELLRTRDVLCREMPPPPARVLDVGGGPGVHAEWLTAAGYTVELIDPVPLHVEQAARIPGVTASVGDARELAAASASQDVVLMLGPLYHLLDRADRLRAWREALRVVRPGGLVAAATISRFASMYSGIRDGMLDDPRFRKVVQGALENGEHHPPPDTPWFTTAYFHHPDEPVAEARDAGLEPLGSYSLEGAAWMMSDADIRSRLDDPERRENLMWGLRQVERDPALLGISSHFLTLARRV
ncbi:class I SAM-dependent methyltransferase [Actinomadura sp. 9N407]|uniref:class I SAM-dependent methyltransferase n=1 Tax=Actinomadura sp. 9N407 TaxID=3375154 RepID=UPI0037961D01